VTAGAADAALTRIMDALRGATAALRTTLRVDLETRGYSVSVPAAESLAPGAASLLQQGGINQRAASTVHWLLRERRTLVQPCFDGRDPTPPQALIDAYGVSAQMLGPLFVDGHLQGWISVHVTGGRRDWSRSDIAALEAAVEEVRALLRLGGP